MVFQLPSNVTSVIIKQKHQKAYRPTKVLYTKGLRLAATFVILKEDHQNCWRGILKIGTKTSDLNVMNVATRQEARRTLDIMSKPGIGKKNILEVSKQKTNIALIKHSEQVLQKGMIYTSDSVTTIFSFWSFPSFSISSRQDEFRIIIFFSSDFSLL